MKSTILLALGLAFTLPLHAADEAPAKEKAKPDAEAIFKKKDKNSDGFLSKEEFTAHAKDTTNAEAMFAKKDKDSDGKLSPEEFAAKVKEGKRGKGGKKKGGSDASE